MQPGETLRLTHAYGDHPFRVLRDDVPFGQPEKNSWVITAPAEPGLYPLLAERGDSDQRTHLNMFVAVPAAEMEGEYLNGYRIGTYPPPRKNRRNYEPPAGFFEVTADNVDTRLTPNFTLRQFLCKQQSGYPKYVVLQESLLVLLEGLLADVRAEGFDIDTFGVISGYRTPWYNKSIGNVRYSRHVYGDAMDFYIDVNKDGLMDDINDDGMRNREDILKFFRIVDAFKARPENVQLVGGVGRYNKTRNHGGYVHADTRGYRARW